MQVYEEVFELIASYIFLEVSHPFIKSIRIIVNTVNAHCDELSKDFSKKKRNFSNSLNLSIPYLK